MQITTLLKTALVAGMLSFPLFAEEAETADKCEQVYNVCTEKCDQTEQGSDQCYEKCDAEYTACSKDQES